MKKDGFQWLHAYFCQFISREIKRSASRRSSSSLSWTTLYRLSLTLLSSILVSHETLRRASWLESRASSMMIREVTMSEIAEKTSDMKWLKVSQNKDIILKVEWKQNGIWTQLNEIKSLQSEYQSEYHILFVHHVFTAGLLGGSCCSVSRFIRTCIFHRQCLHIRGNSPILVILNGVETITLQVIRTRKFNRFSCSDRRRNIQHNNLESWWTW